MPIFLQIILASVFVLGVLLFVIGISLYCHIPLSTHNDSTFLIGMLTFSFLFMASSVSYGVSYWQREEHHNELLRQEEKDYEQIINQNTITITLKYIEIYENELRRVTINLIEMYRRILLRTLVLPNWNNDIQFKIIERTSHIFDDLIYLEIFNNESYLSVNVIKNIIDNFLDNRDFVFNEEEKVKICNVILSSIDSIESSYEFNRYLNIIQALNEKKSILDEITQNSSGQN